ncbi:MAG: cytochrome c [Paracoccaceae bacterium]
MSDKPFTFVEVALADRRRRRFPFTILMAILSLFCMLALVALLWLLIAWLRSGPEHFRDDRQHFLHGSIGSETSSGLPYEVWQALPVLFPEDFENKTTFEAFGFLYQDDEMNRIDLPIGISRRDRLGITLVWFNCAVCHTGTYRETEDADPVIVAGMPSNNLQLRTFIDFLLEASTSPRLAAEPLFEAIDESGNRLGPVKRLFWRVAVLPALREELLATRAALRPLLDRQPAWGPGRVDTFNPYKTLEFGINADQLSETEALGASDFPSIFLQTPREGMQLHWDGNNSSLAERNLSAALGAGVTPDTVDHAGIKRVAAWLGDLSPPASPITINTEAAQRGAAYYVQHCAACHGQTGADGYRFEGELLGKVDPIEAIGTDRARLDSYTSDFQKLQIEQLFAGTPYAFRQFRKTDGYANMPLDGLWLRGPYLHNGSVPTLADLLAIPDDRPMRFVRGSDVIDEDKGGFVSPPCEGNEGFCFDTTLPGNSNSGHVYGTELSDEERADLLEYLKTF